MYIEKKAEGVDCNAGEQKAFMKHFKVRQERRKSVDFKETEKVRVRRNSLPANVTTDVKSMQTHFKLVSTLRSSKRRRQRSRSVDFGALGKIDEVAIPDEIYRDERTQSEDESSSSNMELGNEPMTKFSSLVEAGK